MLIHSAVYGENRGGHALLAHSNDNPIPFEEILDRTDLQGAMPPGAEWKSYLSGFRFKSHYILMRTHPDPNASRGGMVLSRALFIPMEAAVQIENLQSVAALLPSEPTRQTPVSPVQLTVTKDNPELNWTPGAQNLIGLLMESFKRPVVWIGQDGFDDAVFGLWRYLLPNMRSSFAFKLAFGPQDAYLSEFEVVCTPKSLASRWSGFPTTDNKSISSPHSGAVQRLLSADATSDLRTFAGQLDADVRSIGDFALLHQAEVYLLSDVGTIVETLAAIRLFTKLSPNPRAGSGQKGDLIGRLERQLLGARTDELRMMRNLEMQPFLDGHRVWDGVSSRVQVISDNESGSDHSIATLLIQAREFPNSEWSCAVFRGVDNFLLQNGPRVASRLWTWWTKEPASAAILADRIPDNSDFEGALLITCPDKLERASSEPIMKVCQQRSWFTLHAKLAMATYDLPAAIDCHLTVDQQASSVGGLRILTSGMGAQRKIEEALNRGDPRLIEIAGSACADEPAVLRSLDVANDVARAILLRAVESNPAILGQFEGSDKLIAGLLDRLLSGELIDSRLWLLIASGGHGDFSLHPRRSDVWKCLSGDARTALLAVTADGWFSVAGSEFEAQRIEPPLRDAILEPKRLASFLQTSSPSQADTVIRLFHEFDSLSEQLFGSWFARISAQGLNNKTSSAIGRLVMIRGWRRTAIQIANQALRHGRSDLFPAAREFVDLLGFRQRRRISSISPAPQPQRFVPVPPNNVRGVVVLTALDVELGAVLRHLSQIRPERHPQGTIYEVGKFSSFGGTSAWDIAAVQTGPGNAAAAVEAERAISHFHPSYIIFVGVAGGLKDVQVGDVVAATKVYGYETGKSQEEFHTRAEIGQSSYDLVQLARKVARDRKWQNRILDSVARRPDAIVAPVAAGEKVVASIGSFVYKLLRNSFGDAVAVEMESAGFLRAVYSNSKTAVLVVRGVSDLIEGKSEADAQGSQNVASAHAAAFAFEVIANIDSIH